MPERHNFGHVKARHREVRIPDKNERPWAYRWAVARWRLAVVTVTHPVMVACAVAFLIASMPLWMTLQQASENRGLTDAIQHQRVSGIVVFCTHMNANTRAVNLQNDYIQGLIVGGAKQSRSFEKALHALGLPPYAERLRRAEQQAAGLKQLKVAPLACPELVREARAVSSK